MSVDVRKPLKKFLPHLVAARDQNLNEADTVHRIMKAFEDVLGYDPLGELTREMNLKDKYVDLAVKLDGRIRFLVEVKAAGVELRDRHIEQAERYAAENNIRWVVLTNGTTWNLYHLTFEEGIEYSRAFSVDVTVAEKFDDCASCFALLHRKAVAKDALDAFWAHKVALGPASIGRALFHEDTLRFIRRDIRRREELSVDEEDLAKAVHDMLSVDARELIGPLKIRRNRAPRAPKKTAAVVSTRAADTPHEETDDKK
jgi:predicted type IV restriction endonuclease